jgi:hypothetical protein
VTNCQRAESPAQSKQQAPESAQDIGDVVGVVSQSEEGSDVDNSRTPDPEPSQTEKFTPTICQSEPQGSLEARAEAEQIQEEVKVEISQRTKARKPKKAKQTPEPTN